MILAISACGDSDGTTDDGAVIANYSATARAAYTDAVTGAKALCSAIDAFVAAPSPSTLAAARQAWIASRVSYRQTEALRFYGGPIDAPADDVELRVNSWPLDEAFVDYVEGMPGAGIINDRAGTPSITALTLAAHNQVGGDENVSLGYHAVEFLLWGQDKSPTGPGARPHTDYVTGAGGTAANQQRRGDYLKVTCEVLVTDLTNVRDAWTAYAAELAAAPRVEALRRVLTGIGTLAASELSGERMLTAYENRDQEDEHSCFSDTTLDDLAGNLQGIENVYLGKYGTIDGPGLDVLVAPRDAALDTRMKAELAAARAAIAAIPAPFDQAILDDTKRAKVLAAVRAVQTVGDTVVDLAGLLGVAINVET